MRDGLVRVRHVERRYPHRQAADGHRGVGGQRRCDAHLVCETRDPMRADLEPYFGVDRVVRVGGRAEQRVGSV